MEKSEFCKGVFHDNAPCVDVDPVPKFIHGLEINCPDNLFDPNVTGDAQEITPVPSAVSEMFPFVFVVSNDRSFPENKNPVFVSFVSFPLISTNPPP